MRPRDMRKQHICKQRKELVKEEGLPRDLGRQKCVILQLDYNIFRKEINIHHARYMSPSSVSLPLPRAHLLLYHTVTCPSRKLESLDRTGIPHFQMVFPK